jgi:hypothetical protein
MNFDMPKVVFCGLALIAAAIYFGPWSAPAVAHSGQYYSVSGSAWGQISGSHVEVDDFARGSVYCL